MVANHLADLMQGFYVNRSQLAIVIRSDIQRENIPIFHRAEIVSVNLIRRQAKLVMFRQ